MNKISNSETVDVFIVGSKGIPAKYGGFETFTEKLCEGKIDSRIQYHVSCMSFDNNDEFEYKNAKCFNVKVNPIFKGAKVIIYDFLSVLRVLRYVKKNNTTQSYMYVLGCKLSFLLTILAPSLHRRGVKVLLNPDGAEWKRAKWNRFIKMYLKFAEHMMVRASDYVICDSEGIRDYINAEYDAENKTKFIAYGADSAPATTSDTKLVEWRQKLSLSSNEYYIVVARLVPENNFELIIGDFMKAGTKKKLVLITNDAYDSNFFIHLRDTLRFEDDERIIFAGPVYDQDLLKHIRQDAFAYIHGHSVGGTNPSLLESLALTQLTLAYDVSFNNEVARKGAIYFSEGVSVAGLDLGIENAEKLTAEELKVFTSAAQKRIHSYYNWPNICSIYERFFIDQRNS